MNPQESSKSRHAETEDIPIQLGQKCSNESKQCSQRIVKIITFLTLALGYVDNSQGTRFSIASQVLILLTVVHFQQNRVNRRP